MSPAPNPLADVEIVSGRGPVLAYAELLIALGDRLDQQGTMEHLHYFLHFKDAMKKIPHLLLIGPNLHDDLHDAAPSAETLTGAVLLFEYRLLGTGSGVFATDDVGGRRTLLGPAALRLALARRAAEALMERGARAVFLSFVDPASSITAVNVEEPALAPAPMTPRNARWQLATQRRLIRSYLPLLATFDETLARMGQHTRRNMRAYRRKVESKLGCIFVPEIRPERLSRFELKRFNRLSTYAVPEQIAGWRYDSIHEVPGGFLCGMHDRDGQWLAILGGRRFHGAVEIDWQMNRDDLPSYSLSTVLRTYLIEYEIAQGTRLMFFEGGTPHAMRFSFALHLVRDLLVVRPLPLQRHLGRFLPLLRSYINRFLPRSAFILKTLADPNLPWRPWARAEPATAPRPQS